ISPQGSFAGRKRGHPQANRCTELGAASFFADDRRGPRLSSRYRAGGIIKARRFAADIHSRRKAGRQEIIIAPARPVETSERRISVRGDGTDHQSAGCATDDAPDGATAGGRGFCGVACAGFQGLPDLEKQILRSTAHCALMLALSFFAAVSVEASAPPPECHPWPVGE